MKSTIKIKILQLFTDFLGDEMQTNKNSPWSVKNIMWENGTIRGFSPILAKFKYYHTKA